MNYIKKGRLDWEKLGYLFKKLVETLGDEELLKANDAMKTLKSKGKVFLSKSVKNKKGEVYSVLVQITRTDEVPTVSDLLEEDLVD